MKKKRERQVRQQHNNRGHIKRGSKNKTLNSWQVGHKSLRSKRRGASKNFLQVGPATFDNGIVAHVGLIEHVAEKRKKKKKRSRQKMATSSTILAYLSSDSLSDITTLSSLPVFNEKKKKTGRRKGGPVPAMF